MNKPTSMVDILWSIKCKKKKHEISYQNNTSLIHIFCIGQKNQTDLKQVKWAISKQPTYQNI